MDYMPLKSGTDIRGTAVGENADLTERAVYDLTAGFVKFIGKTVIAVGNDSRISANELKRAVINALIDSGCDYYDCGLTSTPAMFMSTQFEEMGCDGAIMLTASHHPYDKNGMKFFTRSGGLNGASLTEVIKNASTGATIAEKKGKRLECDLMGLYKEYLKAEIRDNGEKYPLKNMKIAVDAGNGSGGFFASVLSECGADVSASQFLDPDGRFPNHIPNPEDSDAMKAITAKVTASGCDLGVIFDTDADRAAIVTSDGKEMNRNRLIAIMSAIVLKDNPGATIVTDSVTSSGLTKFITSRGGIHLRFKRGYRNVIDKAIELENNGISAPLAIETSGHGALKSNFYLDDGAFMAVLLVKKAAALKKENRELGDLIADLPEPECEAAFRIKLTGKDWKELGNTIIADLRAYAKRRYEVRDDDYEGVRVYLGQNWFMLRQSVHDPVMVINMEGETDAVRQMHQIVFDFLCDYDGLDESDRNILIK